MEKKLKIIRVELGPFDVNCYVLLCGNESIVIDPSISSLEIVQLMKDHNLRYIVNTHGHFDHIGGNTFLKNGTPSAKIVVHKKDAPMLTNPSLNLSLLFDNSVVSMPPDLIVDDDEDVTIHLCDESFKILFFPGHSDGGIALYNKAKNMLFSGDLIFSNSFGRTDLPGGSIKKMKKSLKKIMKFPDETAVYPGHEEPFRLADFKKNIAVLIEELE